MKGHMVKEETKKKISDSLKELYLIPENCIVYRKSHTNETKEKCHPGRKRGLYDW